MTKLKMLEKGLVVTHDESRVIGTWSATRTQSPEIKAHYKRLVLGSPVMLDALRRIASLGGAEEARIAESALREIGFYATRSES